ncbi:ATP-dependent DNA helicase PcrA [compost metagenome]
MKSNISRLNANQQTAVKTGDGVYQVIACAGSGKTTVLTERVVYLISEHQVDPSNILLTTFSKKAAIEIQERMKKLVNKRVLDDIVISTFHSIGHRILKFEYKKMNDPMYAALEKDPIMGKPQKWMIEGIMKELNYPTNGQDVLTASEAIRVISLAKNELLDVGRFSVECIEEKDFKIAEIYRIYEEKKKELKVIDFDDMLLLFYKLLKENPMILKKYQNKFKYIMIDEAQDNNFAQYQIMKLLAETNKNLFLVGDDDQSMYRFRGARPEEFVEFHKSYENVTIIRLEQNYRSLPAILEVANKLIEKNKIRLIKKLISIFASTPKSEEVKYYSVLNEEQEAEQVAKRIIESHANGVSYKQCAVLFRTSSQTRALEDHFIKNSIPYVIYGGMSFYDRAEVKDIIAYMNLAVNPHDNASFERVVNTPSRYLGKAFIDKLKQEGKKRNCSLYDAMKTVGLTSYQHRNGMEYHKLITSLNTEFNKGQISTVQLIKNIRNLTLYDEMLKKEAKEEDNNVLENLDAFEASSVKYSSATDFLKFIKILTESKLENADAVQMMTIHKSKGLEFPHVSIVGFSNNLMPHRYALESQDPMAIEEERRLAYVAITRAQNQVDIYSPAEYNGKPAGESIFATDGLLKKYSA